MITVDIDGVYCPKCKDLHPTLYWHKKYMDYLTKSDSYESYRKAGARFGVVFTDEECEKEYLFHLKNRKIICKDEAGNCTICGCQTNFMSSEKGQYICSDECHYALGVFKH